MSYGIRVEEVFISVWRAQRLLPVWGEKKKRRTFQEIEGMHKELKGIELKNSMVPSGICSSVLWLTC